MFNYKKILSISIISCTAIFAHSASAAFPMTGEVNTLARVRDSAGFTKVIVVLAENTPVSIVGEKGVWYQILRKDGSKGWIAKELVDVKAVKEINNSTPKIATSTPVKKESIIKPAILKYNSRLRKSPSLKGDIIKVLPSGSKVKVSEKKDSWCSIDESINKGWISCELILMPDDPDYPVKNIDISSYNLASTTIGTVTTADINNYWKDKINALRQEKNLRLLDIDERFQKTADIWAKYIGKIDKATHDRPDGKSMTAWINDTDLDFTVRNSPDGWKVNYFTENIGLRLNVEPSLEGIKSALDGVLSSFLSEGPSGVHYRTVYVPDWNSVGVSWYPVKNSNGKYKIYFVFHYGSLAKVKEI